MSCCLRGPATRFFLGVVNAPGEGRLQRAGVRCLQCGRQQQSGGTAHHSQCDKIATIHGVSPVGWSSNDAKPKPATQHQLATYSQLSTSGSIVTVSISYTELDYSTGDAP